MQETLDPVAEGRSDRAVASLRCNYIEDVTKERSESVADPNYLAKGHLVGRAPDYAVTSWRRYRTEDVAQEGSKGSDNTTDDPTNLTAGPIAGTRRCSRIVEVDEEGSDGSDNAADPNDPARGTFVGMGLDDALCTRAAAITRTWMRIKARAWPSTRNRSPVNSRPGTGGGGDHRSGGGGRCQNKQ